MASQPITRHRFQILDELGIDEVVRIYIEECRTVHQLMERLFPPREDGEKPGANAFYLWLSERDHKERWREAKSLRGSLAADEAVGIALDTTEQTVRSDKLKVDTLKWHASKLAPQEFGDRVDLKLTGDVGQQWMEALIALERSQREGGPAEYLEAEVVEECEPAADDADAHLALPAGT